MHSTLLVLIAATLVSASLVRRDDKIATPTTKKGPKCMVSAESPPVCPKGFFCFQYDTCYEPIPLGQPCNGDTGDCAEPGYCQRDLSKHQPGVCTKLRDVDAACGGPLHDECAKNMDCLLANGKKDEEVGKCVVVPRKAGEACSSDHHCGDKGFCHNADDTKTAGVCAPRATLNKECSGRYGDRIAPPCAPDLACYVKDKGEKGVCLKNHGDIGAKCSFYSELSCDSKKKLYCKMEIDKWYGVCAVRSRLGEKCVDHVPGIMYCAQNLSCYVEDDDTKGTCLKASGNPIGAKCTDGVNCVYGAYCHTVADKKYGVCKAKVAGGQACNGPSSVKCQEGFKCDDKTSVCVNKN